MEQVHYLTRLLLGWLTIPHGEDYKVTLKGTKRPLQEYEFDNEVLRHNVDTFAAASLTTVDQNHLGITAYEAAVLEEPYAGNSEHTDFDIVRSQTQEDTCIARRNTSDKESIRNRRIRRRHFERSVYTTWKPD